MAKKIRARKLRRERRKSRESRTLEGVIAVLLALAALVGMYFAIRSLSLYGIVFCVMWLGGSSFWLFSIFGYRR